MILVALAALAAVVGSEAPVPAAPTRYEVTFAPLKKAERTFADIGPVGPYFPERAYRAGRSGEATLRCRVGPSGTLERCTVLSDKPKDYGFGIAARIMADRKRIVAVGSPNEGETILVRVPFSLGAPVAFER